MELNGTVIGGLIFALGYLGIAIEHKIHMSKSAIALAMGGLLWLVVALTVGGGDHGISEAVRHAGGEIFEIVAFLLAAMSLVEILVHYRLFDFIRGKLFALGLNDRQQFLGITFITFFLSALLDNLTTTIVMVQIARQFFKEKNLLVVAAAIVIAANAGGAWSPIGDVTTIMLWIAGKFTGSEIVLKGILPSLALYVVSIGLMYPQIKNQRDSDSSSEIVERLKRSEWAVIIFTLLSFMLPMVMNAVFHLPPYLGLLIGLGIVWMAVDFFKRVRPHETHLTANIDSLIQKADIASIKFFIGILLAVSALHSLGALEILSDRLYGHDATTQQMITGNIGLGLVSAILDNVPLAAIAIQILHTTDVNLWVLLALTLGTGGSLLVIGSAAGVVAMGMLKELTFATYLRIATLPALAGYVAGVTVWWIQTYAFK